MKSMKFVSFIPVTWKINMQIPETNCGGLFVLLQLDIRGDPYGLLAAHPVAPLVSLHHLDSLGPLFPNQSRRDSVENLLRAYRVDPARTLQQVFCYDHKRKWSISISWGYTVQIYPTMLAPKDLQMPLMTFRTWRSGSEGPFTFNTRPVSPDPCQEPLRYFLDQIEEVGRSGSFTSYKRFVDKDRKCLKPTTHNEEIQRIGVSALKLDPQYWKNVLTLSLSLTHSHTPFEYTYLHQVTRVLIYSSL